MTISPVVRRRAAAHALASPCLPALVIVLIGLAYGLVATLNVATLVRPAQLSLALVVPRPSRAWVAWVMPGGTLWEQGVREGDTVLTLDGQRPTHQDGGIWRGQRLRVRTMHRGMILITARAQSTQATTWPLLVLSPWFLLLGTLVVVRALQPSMGRITYTLFASAAFALAFAPGADSDDVVATVLEWSMVALFATPSCAFS